MKCRIWHTASLEDEKGNPVLRMYEWMEQYGPVRVSGDMQKKVER